MLADIFKPIFKEYGFKKKANSWYLVNREVIGIMNIQKSQWSNLCYLNLALFIRKDEPMDYLPNTGSHIQLRFEELISSQEQEEKERLLKILSFQNKITENDITDLQNLTLNRIIPFFLKFSTKQQINTARKESSKYFWEMIAYDGRNRLDN